MRRTAVFGICLMLLAAGGWALAGHCDLSAMEQLGKLIFFDEDLSMNENQACAACHSPAACLNISTGLTLSCSRAVLLLPENIASAVRPVADPHARALWLPDSDSSAICNSTRPAVFGRPF